MTKRTTVADAETMLGAEILCLDHGFVIPIDYMGSDNDIVQAARTSFGPSSKPKQDDRSLLRYLMRHRHTTPFEMCEVKFLCRVPIFVARQWIRHRMSSTNEMSLRYSEPLELFYIPAADKCATQSTSNRQGRGEKLEDVEAQLVARLMAEDQAAQLELYRKLADEFGLAKELARAVLPVSLYTQWVWKIDAHNLLHFLGLRLDAHAQYEIRVFAEAMASFVRAWLPLTWEAFEDYKLKAATFSRQEREVLMRILYDATEEAMPSDRAGTLRGEGRQAGLEGRELDELVAKLTDPEKLPA